MSSVLMVIAYTGPPTLAPSQVFWGVDPSLICSHMDVPLPRTDGAAARRRRPARSNPLRPGSSPFDAASLAPAPTGPFITAPDPVGTASSVARYPALPRYPPRCGDTVGSRAPARIVLAVGHIRCGSPGAVHRVRFDRVDRSWPLGSVLFIMRKRTFGQRREVV